IRIDGDHVLVAQLKNDDGELIDSSIDLDEILGNDDGQFQWGDGNFSKTADDVELDFEGEVPVLQAQLTEADGSFVPAEINLAERIINENGDLVFA
ncbi:CVNH domain-containing protein, partial [Aspergillus glaucus CBS 516.65]